MTFELCPKSLVHGTAVALSLVLTMALSGCDSTSPVAAPTSTLPAPAAQPTPTVPPYETDLDLSAEEKEAVEGALLALDGYVTALNQGFSSGGTDTTEIETYAQGEALRAFDSDVRSLRANNQYMAGVFKLSSREIHSLELEHTRVIVLSCVNNAAFSQVERGETLKQREPELLKVQFITVFESGQWKVDSQDLWSENCDT